MLRLSQREVRSLGGFIEALSSPLGHADSGAWRREVIARGQELLSVDRAAFGLSWEATKPVADAGLDPAATAAYVEYYHRIDGFAETRHRRKPIAGIRRELANGWPFHPEFRHDFLERFKLDAGAGMAHFVAGDAAGWCSFYPDTDDPERFEERAVQLFQIALPAFRAGLGTAFRTRGLRAELAQLLDRVSDGFLLADARGRILHRNPALGRMLAADSGTCSLERGLEAILLGFSAAAGDVARAAQLFPVGPLATHHGPYDLAPTFPDAASHVARERDSFEAVDRGEVRLVTSTITSLRPRLLLELAEPVAARGKGHIAAEARKPTPAAAALFRRSHVLR